MKIKTYPLHFTEDYLEKIREKAEALDISIKEYILQAIAEKMRKGE